MHYWNYYFVVGEHFHDQVFEDDNHVVEMSLVAGDWRISRKKTKGLFFGEQ